ncbi:hypothetical protein niasHT_031407 [Heterodera trifolii]|uniref:RING-type domain-containing protein n=1 Tax=Heterodera trifolii TaxID=157864 RepID=A0ABD2HY84_9BILA
MESPNAHSYKQNPTIPWIFLSAITLVFLLACFIIICRCCLRARHPPSDRMPLQNAGDFVATPAQIRSGLDAFEAMTSIQYGAINNTTNSDCFCLEIFENDTVVKQLPCGHVFHTECISEWLRQHITCPSCRAAVANPQ